MQKSAQENLDWYKNKAVNSFGSSHVRKGNLALLATSQFRNGADSACPLYLA